MITNPFIEMMDQELVLTPDRKETLEDLKEIERLLVFLETVKSDYNGTSKN